MYKEKGYARSQRKTKSLKCLKWLQFIQLCKRRKKGEGDGMFAM
uniref:Uncharacterized protein n=1 Tax=Anguilla anguilla TaxID=7936 RepID=A0A0E9SWY3_ANGAN